MATPTVKSTYSLDLDTVQSLERLARQWGISKSEAIRRAVKTAAASVPDERAEALAALDRLQQAVAKSGIDVKAWARNVRAERKAWSRKLERSGRR